MRAAVCQRDDVVDFLRRRRPAFPQAHLAQRVRGEEACAGRAATPRYSGASSPACVHSGYTATTRPSRAPGSIAVRSVPGSPDSRRDGGVFSAWCTSGNGKALAGSLREGFAIFFDTTIIAHPNVHFCLNARKSRYFFPAGASRAARRRRPLRCPPEEARAYRAGALRRDRRSIPQRCAAG